MFHRTPTLLKFILLLPLLFLLLGQPPEARAQTAVSTIESLAVDIWPDYDRPSVLILLTGILPADASLPATVTVPLSEGAELTAIARIGSDNNMFADIVFDESVPGEVTLTTPDPRFRVEYYMPYELNGDERTFTFEWQADVSVTQMLVSVQQPIATTEMTTDPAVFSVTPRQDGFQYHNLSPQEVLSGERLSLQVSYRRSATQLSAELLQPESPANGTANTIEPESEQSAESGLDVTTVLLISGGIAVLGVGLWMMFGKRITAARQSPAKGRSKPTKGKQVKAQAPKAQAAETVEPAESPSAPSYVQFCHQCGQKAEANDRFCRSCGTRLKK